MYTALSLALISDIQYNYHWLRLTSVHCVWHTQQCKVYSSIIITNNELGETSSLHIYWSDINGESYHYYN